MRHFNWINILVNQINILTQHDTDKELLKQYINVNYNFYHYFSDNIDCMSGI